MLQFGSQAMRVTSRVLERQHAPFFPTHLLWSYCRSMLTQLTMTFITVRKLLAILKSILSWILRFTSICFVQKMGQGQADACKP